MNRFDSWTTVKLVLVLLSFLTGMLMPENLSSLTTEQIPSFKLLGFIKGFCVATAFVAAIWQPVIAFQLINPFIKGKWAYPGWSASLSLFKGPLPWIHLLGWAMTAQGFGLVARMIVHGRSDPGAWGLAMLAGCGGLGTLLAAYLSATLFGFRMDKAAH